MENVPFEDAVLLDMYDVALTSPPYYDTEWYSDEPTQARLRWGTFDTFVEGFYVPMIEKAARHAKRGFVLNVGDRKYPLSKIAFARFGGRVKVYNAASLSGSGGMGKEKSVGEQFLLVLP